MCVIKSFLKLPTLLSLHHYTPMPAPNHTPTYIYVSLIDLIQSHINHKPYIRSSELHHGSYCKYILLVIYVRVNFPFFFVCLCRKKHFLPINNISKYTLSTTTKWISVCTIHMHYTFFYNFLLIFMTIYWIYALQINRWWHLTVCNT